MPDKFSITFNYNGEQFTGTFQPAEREGCDGYVLIYRSVLRIHEPMMIEICANKTDSDRIEWCQQLEEVGSDPLLEPAMIQVIGKAIEDATT